MKLLLSVHSLLASLQILHVRLTEMVTLLCYFKDGTNYSSSITVSLLWNVSAWPLFLIPFAFANYSKEGKDSSRLLPKKQWIQANVPSHSCLFSFWVLPLTHSWPQHWNYFALLTQHIICPSNVLPWLISNWYLCSAAWEQLHEISMNICGGDEINWLTLSVFYKYKSINSSAIFLAMQNVQQL